MGYGAVPLALLTVLTELVMVYIVMACIAISTRLWICSHGLYSYGLYVYGLYSYGLYSHL